MKFGMKSIAGAAALAFSVVGASAASAATTFDFTQGSLGGLGDYSLTNATPTTATYYAEVDANHELGVAGASNNLLAKGLYTFTWDLSGNDNYLQPADTVFSNRHIFQS